MKTDLKYNYTDNGFCRVYYIWKNSKNQRIHYCAQDEGNNVIEFYRCTGGDYEPDYPVKLLNCPPLSPGDTETDKNVNEWIKSKWSLKWQVV